MYKRLICLVLVMVCVFLIGITNADASSRITVYDDKTWTVYLDSPDNAKPYYHLHFYKKGSHIYCLRLDNFKYCDGKDDKDAVPKWLMEKVMENGRVQSAVKYHNPNVEQSSVFKTILKIGAITLGAILVILAAFNVFTGPADDVVAWAYFLKALAM